MTELALEGVGFVYPDGTRALDGVDLRSPPARASRSSARTAAASRRSSATSTACSGRPRAASSTTASTSPGSASQSWRHGRDRLPEPRPPDLRGQGPARGRVRAAEPRAVGKEAEAAVTAALDAVGLSDLPTPTRTTSAIRAGSSWRSHRSSRWRRRSWSSTSRRPGRTRAASPGRARGQRPRRRRADGHRDQPRHAVRRRDVRAGRRHGRRPGRAGRHAGRGLRRTAWPTLASTYLEPPLAAASAPGSGLARHRPTPRWSRRWPEAKP